MVQLTELPDDDPNWNGWFVECVNASCAATTNIHFGEAQSPLIEKWNRRADFAAYAEHYRQMIADRHIGAGRTSAVLYESDAIAEINTVGEIAATSPATEESP